jgi:undecaprenyl-diphosphatase
MPEHRSTPVAPRRARHVLEAALALGALAVVAFLALGIRIDPAMTGVDGVAVGHAHEIALGLGTTWARAIADLAASETVLGLTALIALVLAARRHWHGALALAVSVGASQGVVALVKGVVARDRPPGDEAMVHAAGYSFPSAHSATSVAFYGVLALIAGQALQGRASRAWAIAGASVICLAIGLSRVYLGAHYPTDVLAGWLLGCVIAFGSWRGALALRGRVALAPA